MGQRSASHSFTWTTPERFEMATRRRVAVDRRGASLRRGVIIADEMARCNLRDVEIVSGQRQARKQFAITRMNARAAAISPHLRCDRDEAALEVIVNGHLTRYDYVKEPPYWARDWTRIDIPTSHFRDGINEVVFRSPGEATWSLLLENSLLPDRSSVSEDGGRTWRSEELGDNNRADGEYVARLWLDQHELEGEICSEAIDLLLPAGRGIGVEGTLLFALIEIEGETPAGTDIELQWRQGHTPSYRPDLWTAWKKTDGIEYGDDTTRFAQWRALLRTDDPAVTPTLRALRLTAEVEAASYPVTHRIARAENPELVRSSYRFAHHRQSDARGEQLRKRWQLDKVVGPAKTEFEALVLLRQWVREQWEDGWNMGPLDYCPPWDALVILELAGQQLSLGMCTHYATVFTHCCAALGFTARTQIMRNHCITEVWSSDYGKWVAMDPGGDDQDVSKYTYHFERDGMPMSALEVQRAWLGEDLTGVAFSPPPAPELRKRFNFASRMHLWDRFMINLRNDELASLEPGEPEHGKIPYHYDGYLFWADAMSPQLPWFSKHTNREGDLYWTVNRARIHLRQTDAQPEQTDVEREPSGVGRHQTKSGLLRVDLETETPNLARYEVRLNNGGWEPRPQSFAWSLRPGENRFEVRTVNEFGRAGAASSVTVAASGETAADSS